MKKTLYILCLFAIVFTNLHSQTDYYIATTGTDGAGVSGDITHPWKTLVYACTRATTAGDSIHVTAGNYSEGICVVSEGVSIVGEGQTSKIVSTYTTNDSRQGMLQFGQYGETEGTDGSHVVRGLWLDGNSLAASRAIGIVARSNIKIYNCKITNFKYSAIVIQGNSTTTGIEPSTYASDIQIYSDTITNCSLNESGNGYGAIKATGTDSLIIRNCHITQVDRAVGSNGYLFSGWVGYNKDTRIYSNTFKKLYRADASPDIALEFGKSMGGIQIYNNTIDGGSIDPANTFSVKGDFDYSFYIHDNTITQDSMSASPWETYGVTFEASVSDAIVTQNVIQNKWMPLSILNQFVSNTSKRIYIYYNIIDGVGWRDGASGNGIRLKNNLTTTLGMDSICVWNNVFYDDGTGDDPHYGVYLQLVDTVTSIHVENNIFQGFSRAWLMTQYLSGTTGTADSLFLTNNITYGNGNSNDPWYFSFTPTHIKNSDNLKSDPLFVSAGTNFDIQSASPAINAGMDVGLTTDYVDSTFASDLDIGAYEYYDDNPATDPIVVTSSKPYKTSYTTATGTGNVTSDGGGTISARGLCWSTSANPTTADSKTSETGTTGSFTSTITGLTKGSTYHVRAYATNETSTTYGADRIITTIRTVIIK